MVVRFSFSDEQLREGGKKAFEDCKPIQTFADLSRLFKRTIDRPLFVRSAEFNKTYAQQDLLYPCGFRTLTAVQRTRGSPS